MKEYKVISCYKCGQKLKIPSKSGTLRVKCPTCGKVFFIKNGIVVNIKEQVASPSISAQIKRKRKNPVSIILKVVGIIFVLLVLIFLYKQFAGQKLIIIRYADLLEKNLITHSGQTLHAALQDTFLKGEVQPYVDKYSYLLQPTVEMIFGPDSLPHHSVIDQFPVGSKQPAWVAVFRGGRIFVTTDNKSHARVFLLGDDPEKAYKENYPIIRHCLSALLPKDSSELSVEVFAYKNKYQDSELKLNLNAYKFNTSNFPPTEGKISIDLLGLKEFFEAAGQLEGAKLDKNSGLILYAKRGLKQTVNGQPISLSDFVVAYRAIFHAGDNKAYISLDPHEEPTKAKVNFGGFLEDTKIGSVVLEADKRFKTITCGLDPNTFKDLRDYTRNIIPSFLTCAERDLLTEDFGKDSKWIGTRFWFYPESIRVETDYDLIYAEVKKPQFRADAERSRDDFASLVEFDRKKRTTLSPSIRTNIDHLNHNYSKYSKVYREIRELTCVARLMGICTWLNTANPDWLDLDMLLAVELPAHRTESERTQLMAVSYVSYFGSKKLSEKFIKRNTKVIFLSKILEEDVKHYFRNTTNLSRFLCYKYNKDVENFEKYKSEAMDLLQKYKGIEVREMIKSEKDLKAIASYASSMIEVPFVQQLLRLDAEITRLDAKISNTIDHEIYNMYVEKYNRLVKQAQRLVKRIEELNLPSEVEIGGGIDLEPEHFTVEVVSRSSMKNFIEIVKKTDTKWQKIDGSGEWLRSRTKHDLSDWKDLVDEIIDEIDWEGGEESKSDSLNYIYYAGGKNQNYWLKTSNTGNWHDLLELGVSLYRERIYYRRRKEIQIINFKSGDLTNYIIGRWIGRKKIVFSTSSRGDLIAPQEPPVWWLNKRN